jgi:uroporphyrinogen decarboxylase
MNKVERVRAALAGAEVDRVPASFWFHFPRDKARGEASVKAHLDYYRASGIDFLKIMNEHPYQANINLKTPADWRQVRPAPLSSSFYQGQLDEIKRIVDALQGECLTVTTIFGPFSSGNHAANNLVTEHLKTDPAPVSQGLAAIAESLAEFAVACVEAGASGIYYSAQGGEADRFTEEAFLRYIKPHDLTVLNAVKDDGEFHLLHICKDHIRLPLYADYPGHAVNWAATKNNLNLKEGQALFKRPVVGGMGDRGIIVDGSPEAIQGAVQKVIADFGARGLIVGADCTLPTDIAVDNIRLAVEATARSV